MGGRRRPSEESLVSSEETRVELWPTVFDCFAVVDVVTGGLWVEWWP